jgi:hypothetical protein
MLMEIKELLNMSNIEPFAGEPHKDRFLAALRGERTDRVPHFEILIEDQHVEKLLGRPAGNTLGVGGDPAKGAAAEGTRPMYPRDYIELCWIIGQDMIALEAIWTPIKHLRPDGSVGPITDRSIKTRADLDAEGSSSRLLLMAFDGGHTNQTVLRNLPPRSAGVVFMV